MAGSLILIYLLKEFRSILAGMYTDGPRYYLKMASGTPRRTNGTPWRTGGTPTAEYSLNIVQTAIHLLIISLRLYFYACCLTQRTMRAMSSFLTNNVSSVSSHHSPNKATEFPGNGSSSNITVFPFHNLVSEPYAKSSVCFVRIMNI